VEREHLLTPLPWTLGSKGEGDATADKSEVDAVETTRSKLDFEKLEESIGAKKVIGGKGDLYASLTMKEKGSRKLMSSLEGTFSLRGDNLIIYTMDLDEVLSKYETSQKFNLVDLGAFFIAGPLGTVALISTVAPAHRYWDVTARAAEGGVPSHSSSLTGRSGMVWQTPLTAPLRRTITGLHLRASSILSANDMIM
jgi:hypothetical protein